MLYLEKVCQVISVSGILVMIGAVIYVKVTSPIVTAEMIKTEEAHEEGNLRNLIDYKRDRSDCFVENTFLSNDEEIMGTAMTKCLEERGH